jgi:hypothetical protein
VARAENKDYTGESHGRWAFHYRLPCRFVFEGTNDGHPSLALVSGGQEAQVRLRYAFYEDRIVAALIQPTDPHAEFEMWLGIFDALGEARVNASGTRQEGKETVVLSDWSPTRHSVPVRWRKFFARSAAETAFPWTDILDLSYQRSIERSWSRDPGRHTLVTLKSEGVYGTTCVLDRS